MNPISILEKPLLSATEVKALLTRQTFDDAIKAGWLKPCCVKENEKRNRNIYALRDVRALIARMEGGEYPS